MSGYCSLARLEMLTLFPRQTQLDVFGPATSGGLCRQSSRLRPDPYEDSGSKDSSCLFANT